MSMVRTVSRIGWREQFPVLAGENGLLYKPVRMVTCIGRQTGSLSGQQDILSLWETKAFTPL